uniref:Cathepsin propeptide inhibitor domain-containing protein n=1 Tax=Ditylenchus dipsaci TaxID=166011 RepID=A0A915DZH0_9BILA
MILQAVLQVHRCGMGSSRHCTGRELVPVPIFRGRCRKSVPIRNYEKGNYIAPDDAEVSVDGLPPCRAAAKGKVYGEEEDKERKGIFLANLEFIRKHNEAYARNEVSSTVGVNHMADWRPEELKTNERCNLKSVKGRGEECKAGMRIRYLRNLSVASKAWIQTTGEHDHRMLHDKGLSSPVKRSIEAKDEPFGGMTASRIARKLQTEPELAELKLPTVEQIQNQKAYRARQRGFTNTLTIEELQEYYNQHKAIPGDEDESFVVAFEERTILTNESGEMKVVTQFVMVFSTVRLLRRQVFWPVMQVDGTYKLMTLNYPLLVCGFSDADTRFFPTGAAISSHEGKWSYGRFMHAISRWDPVRLYEPKLMIADGAPPITSGKFYP